MDWIGDFKAGATVRHMYGTNGQDGASITRSTDGTLTIYKNNSATQRTSLAGVTQVEDFDSLTGVHHIVIDLSDNTDAGFYAAGNEYFVVLVGAVIDTKTVNAPLFSFSIENRSPFDFTRANHNTAGTFGEVETAAGIAGAVADEALAGHVTAGSLGKALSDILAAVDTEIATIKNKTDNLPTDPADASDIAASFATVNATLATLATYIDTEVAAIKNKTDQLTFTVVNKVDANPTAINGSATAAANLAKTTAVIGRGTVSGSPSTTSIPTSAFTPNGAVANQFAGRVITFDADTTTAALRGQSTAITANSADAAPTFTVIALTTAPASGDTFSVT